MKNITTILFDVGGPLVDDDFAVAQWHRHLLELIKLKTGRQFSMADIDAALALAIESYAPSFISFIIWELVKPDETLYSELRAEVSRFPFEKYFQDRPEVNETLTALHTKFKLGIAANQNREAGIYLEEKGILKYFQSRLMSQEIGYSKPDIRLFQRVLVDLNSTPEETIMVGDRPDNDIVPAKLLGMTAIRINCGYHKNQKVHYPTEKPDYVIENISELVKIPEISAKLGR
jgi:HAD superfamily hydrolase (TIGR01549 family)